MVNYHILENSIVLSHNGKNKVIGSEDKLFKQVLEAIRSDDLEALENILSEPQIKLPEALKLDEHGILRLDGETVSTRLQERILGFIEDDLPFQPLINFVRKLRQNPSYNSRQMLYNFLEHNGHPITKDGNFIAYRGISEDFKDLHTGRFDNSVGSICEINRSEVDDNPNNTCSHGLHVACYNYAKDFGRRLVEVEVSPEDVVCVPTDYNGTKMRVCKFKVLAECEVERDEHLYLADEGDYDFDSWEMGV